MIPWSHSLSPRWSSMAAQMVLLIPLCLLSTSSAQVPDSPVLSIEDVRQLEAQAEQSEELNSTAEDSLYHSDPTPPCPTSCQCTPSGITCTNAGLTSLKLLDEVNWTSIITMQDSSDQLTLNWSGNFLVEFDCTDLTSDFDIQFSTLILDSNRINHIFCQEKTPSVTSLSLRNNRLQHFELSVLNFYPNLKHLDLANNRIHSFVGSMTPSSITYLNLTGNKMADLKPKFFHHFRALESLDLSDNGIYSLTSDDLFSANKNLSHLNISHNKINKILPNVFRMLSLNGTLNLGHNSLHHLPTSALHSGFFRRVILDGNSMSHFDSREFQGIKVVQLELSHLHRLKTIAEEAFSDLLLLKKLSITNNPHLVFINPNFSTNLPSLKELQLSHNGLVALGKFSQVKSLERLDISGNPFTCSCYLKWMQQVDKAVQLVNHTGVKCQNRTASRESAVQSVVFGDECSAQVYPLFPMHKSMFISEHLSFQCAAFGVPMPAVKWVYQNGTEVPSNCSTGTCQTPTGKLVFPFLTLSDGGVYTCVAENSQGSPATRTVRVDVQNVHVTLSAVTISSNFVTLAWNGSSLLACEYILEYKNNRNVVTQHELEVSPNSKTHTFSVKNLDPGRTYNFHLSVGTKMASVKLSSLTVTTRPEDYTKLLGVRSDYLSVLVICCVASVASCTCILVCLVRSGKYVFRRVYYRVTGKSWDTISERGLLNSTSTTSDVAFISISYNIPASDACFLISQEEIEDDDIPRM